MTTHKCAIPTCKEQIPTRILMCARHWRQVPRHLQGRLWQAWKLWQEDVANTIAYREYSALRMEAIRSVNPAPLTPHPAMTPIYLAGYRMGGSGTKDGTPKLYSRKPETLREITDHLSNVAARVIDIRYMPYSKPFPEWNHGALLKLLGPRYFWFREWGDLNYKGSVEIANFDAGLRRLEALSLARPAPSILLCACRDQCECHRVVVGKFLKDRGYTVCSLDWAIHEKSTPKTEVRHAEPSLF